MKTIKIFLIAFFCFIISGYSQTSLLFVENFDNVSNFSNWSQSTISGESLWSISQGLPYGEINAPYSGNSNASFYSYNYNSDQTMLISPVIDLSNIDVPVLKFYHIQPIWSSDQDELTVMYRFSEDTEWYVLNTYTYNVSEWAEQALVLPDASSTYQIAFLAKSGYGYGIGLDSLCIVEGETCNMTKNFNFLNIKETSAYCTWESIEDNTYEIEYGAQEFEFGEGTRISHLNNNTYQLNQLNPGENYSLYIRSYCSNGVSNWSGPYNFYTECNINQLIPYTENFENNENPIECWQTIYSNLNPPAGNEIAVVNDESFSGQNSLRFSSYETGSPYDQYLISPQIIYPEGQTLELNFKYKALLESNEVFAVGFSSDINNPLNGIVWSEDITDAENYWEEFSSIIPEGTTNIIIHYKSEFEYYLYLDELRINFDGQCDAAENILAEEISQTSATITWTGNSSSYKIEYGPIGFAKGTGDIVSSINDNSISISNLIPSTDYSAYIITDCEGINIFSEACNFTTLDIAECEQITELLADSITQNSATIIWEAPNTQNLWTVEFGLSGFTVENGTTIQNITEAKVELSSLDSNTEYDFYVHGMCDESGEYADWSNKFSFTTLSLNLEEINDSNIIKPTVELFTTDSVKYICNDADKNQKINLGIQNTGKCMIPAGTEISYLIASNQQNTNLESHVELAQALYSGETYLFSIELNIDVNQIISASLTKEWKTDNYETTNIQFIIIESNIDFENEVDGIIETNEFPELLSVNFSCNYDFNNRVPKFTWENNETGNDRFVYNEGLYTVTVSTDFCSVSKSVNVINETPDNNNSSNYEIYPNPSQNGQINLVNNSSTNNTNVIIYDAAGRNVFSTTLSSVEKQVDLNSLAAGIYNVAFIQNENVELKRLFIE